MLTFVAPENLRVRDVLGPVGPDGYGVVSRISVVSPEQYLAAVVAIPSPRRAALAGGWVFDKDPQQLPAPPPLMAGGADAWAAANGGVPASGNYIEVTLQGLNGHTVNVNSVSVNIVSRTEPPHGPT
jgi:hypothetical protein